MATPLPTPLRPACQRKIMCLIPQTFPKRSPAPPAPLLTSMGKWANGKLKVEHVAAPQGGRQGKEAGQQHWASVLWSVLSYFGGWEVAAGG